MDCPDARGGDQRYSRTQQECDRGREQSERPVRALSPERNRFRAARSHPQVRWRTVHATPHCRISESATGRRDPAVGSCPRSQRVRMKVKKVKRVTMLNREDTTHLAIRPCNHVTFVTNL